MKSVCCMADVEYKNDARFLEQHKYYINGYAVCQKCGKKCELVCDSNGFYSTVRKKKAGERL